MMRNLLWKLLMPEKVEYIRIRKGLEGLLFINGSDWHKVKRLSKIMDKTFTEMNEMFYPGKTVKRSRMFGWKYKVQVCFISGSKVEYCWHEVYERGKALYVEA